MPRITSIKQRQLTATAPDQTLDQVLSRILIFNPSTGFSNTVLVIALQSDGKILVGGNFTSYAGVSQSRITRLNADGTRDTGFTIGTGFNGTVEAIAEQSDGKIVVGGEFTSYNGVTQNRIIRLNADGTRDTGFTIGTGFDGPTVDAIALQSDGKIVVGGNFTSYDGVTQNNITRLNADGTRDTGFTIGTGFSSWIWALAVQSDDKIVVGGDFISYDGTAQNRITRLNTDGTRDTGFTIGGGFNGQVYTIAIQSDDKILVGGGFFLYGGAQQNRMTRLNTDGTRDTGFTIGTAVGTGFNNTVYAIAVQSDGKILVGGQFTSYNGVTQNRITRLNADGTRDTSFTIGTGFNNSVWAIVEQSDDKIVVGGQFTSYNSETQNRIAALNGQGGLLPAVALPVATYSTAVSSTSLIGIDQPLTVTVTTSNVSNGTTLNWAMIGDSRDSFDPITASVTVSSDEAVISTTTVSNPAAGSVSMAIAKTGGTVVAVTEVISVSISAVSPANTSPPSISGTQTIGSVLTCSPGTWTGVPSPTFTYQWRRNSLAISGSTDSTYTIVDQDFDAQISCAVTATNTVGSTTEVSNSTSAIPASAPVNTALPTISGSALVGSILTSSTGTWTGAPSPTYTYQWQRGSSNISGATNSTYTIVSADVGNTLRCVVTATNSAAAVSATSQSTVSVSPTYSVSPAANNVDEGSSLSFTVTTAGVANDTTLYWTVTNAGDFATASGSFTITDNSGTFSVTPTADAITEGAETFQAQVRTGSTSGDIVATSTSVTINDTSVGISPFNTSLPTITGSATVFSTLTCSTGSWTGNPTFSYQWQRGSSNISGATGNTYEIQSADMGSTLRCVVTATNDSGSTSATTTNTSSVPVVTVGQQAYTSAGTYSWTCPSGVTSVSVVAVGGGGGGGGQVGGAGGGGGGLGWQNNISVNPGQTYTVVVGAGGATNNDNGAASYFINTSTVRGGGGGAGSATGGAGGSFTGGGGGNGGSGASLAGGGAAGYTGNGGNGANGTNQPGGSGSGGGAAGARSPGDAGGFSPAGGGVGLNGRGASGIGAINNATEGGSGGTTGGYFGNPAGIHGGGCGYGSANGGGVGGVRIIWPGNTRLFPDTNTNDK